MVSPCLEEADRPQLELINQLIVTVVVSKAYSKAKFTVVVGLSMVADKFEVVEATAVPFGCCHTEGIIQAFVEAEAADKVNSCNLDSSSSFLVEVDIGKAASNHMDLVSLEDIVPVFENCHHLDLDCTFNRFFFLSEL